MVRSNLSPLITLEISIHVLIPAVVLLQLFVTLEIHAFPEMGPL